MDHNQIDRQEYGWLSVKARLYILLAIMILPFIAFSIYKAIQIDNGLQQEAKTRNLFTARNIAQEVDDYILSTGDVLIAITSNEAIKTQDFAKAKPWLNEMLTKYPFYHLLAFVDPKGDVKVAAVSSTWAKSEDVQKLSKTFNVSDTACYRRGIVTNGVSVGDFMYSRITGMPVVHVTYPVFDYSGKRIGFIAAAFDLTKIQNRLMITHFSKGSVICVIDDKGTMIARNLEPKKWVGKNLSAAKCFDKMPSQVEGTGEIKTTHGISQVYAFAHTTNAPWLVRIGLDESIIRAQVKDQLMNHFEVFIPLFLLALLGWLWIGKDVNKLHKHVEYLSLTDPLTMLWNYRKLCHDLEQEINRANRYGDKVSFIMIDVDDFKYYNDHNGHQSGDQVLHEIAQILLKTVRDTDSVYRYGGEEICVILPKTDRYGAYYLAERIRENIMIADFVGKENQPTGNLTISAGVATLPYDSTSKEGLIKCSDTALYKAKNSGKNRIVTYSEESLNQQQII